MATIHVKERKKERTYFIFFRLYNILKKNTARPIGDMVLAGVLL
jgi:hypothetical protein